MKIYDKIFALGYDRFLGAAERDGLSARRHELLAKANGRVLEIGAGTGLNLEHYGRSITRLVLTEPSEPMARRLRARVKNLRPEAEVEIAPGERLPFEDGTFDFVVSTLVLCTVADPATALNQARRVLSDGGRLLFLEHVRWDDARRATWQDRLERPWQMLGNGCHCNRDTEALIARAGFEIETIDHGEMPHAPPIVRPLIVGVAVAASLA